VTFHTLDNKITAANNYLANPAALVFGGHPSAQAAFRLELPFATR